MSIASPVSTTGAEHAKEWGVSSSAHTSGVSWVAIFAGAAGAAVLSLILLILGTGLGFSIVSPWSNTGASAGTLGGSAIAWLAFTQIAASVLGGYLAGRLRIRWAGLNHDEVYFRDTAHGFLSWAVSTLATAALLTSTIGAVLGGGVQLGSALSQGTAQAVSAATASAGAAAGQQQSSGGADDGTVGYMVDTLFRSDNAASAASADNNARRDEVAKILVKSLRAGGLTADDKRYIGQLIAQHTGLTPLDAERRATEVHARMAKALADAEAAAKAAADKARKAVAYASLWMFVALMCGAFTASVAALWGGRQRDQIN